MIALYVYIRMGEKADWSAAHVKLFCELCANEVLAGHRPLGQNESPTLLFQPPTENLKRNYSTFMELKKCCYRTWME
jgi:hypothetical protein